MTRDRLVLWDIDHTLMEGGGVASRALAIAFQQATGSPMTQPWPYEGRTDLASATEVLLANGFSPSDGLLETFMELIVAEILSREAELAALGRALPGAVDALNAVHSLGGVQQSVLTGNLRPVAELKVTCFGLGAHIDLRIGAYGGDAYERTDLPRYAFERAEAHLGRRYTGAQTVIVGDTLRDVYTAHAAGARAVAVATGFFTADQLRAAGADTVLTDLTDISAVVNAITR